MSDLFWICLALLPVAVGIFWWSIGWSFRANGGPLQPTGLSFPYMTGADPDAKNACLFSGAALAIGLPIALAVQFL